MMLKAYVFMTALLAPILRLHLALRVRQGKEDAGRLSERMGHPSCVRPAGPLVWFHAASVGESLSILSLIGSLMAQRKDIAVLVTTGTLTSARLMGKRLPKGVIHQFMPLDCLPWVRRFLDAWHPDLALWTESEFWPVMLSEIRMRRIPAVLLNGRLSERSARRWKKYPVLARTLLSAFRFCLAQTQGDATRLAAIGAPDVALSGNLKYASDPLPAAPEAVEALSSAIGGRVCWLYASTHPGEEDMAAHVHKVVAEKLPGLLTILAPRHPQRGVEVAAMLRAEGLSCAVRSAGETIAPGTEVYVADTMGEMGLLFRVVPVVVMGGSFVPHGGHNPIEPAQLGCAILYGPHMFNFKAVCADLEKEGAALPLTGSLGLAEALQHLLVHPEAAAALARAAGGVAERNRDVLGEILSRLHPLLPGGRA
ncbi:MAG TPA: 3-deoxy-D-manno-octulosonic acid transferase [Rhodospirillaceae bacterium]|nr:MAG: 3-deoxy-D-manno-octulosonic acid transferase [Alphaproteobacteria bacterium GWF2_58_20]HAU28528.1 3-deoxy-D-manno-octulosonic acid transferase [Rhodospirillaceae bacterium]